MNTVTMLSSYRNRLLDNIKFSNYNSMVRVLFRNFSLGRGGGGGGGKLDTSTKELVM